MLRLVVSVVAFCCSLTIAADAETRCTTPEAPEHGTVQLFDESKTGTIAFYFCDDNTTLVGESISECLNSGDWTFDPPKCLSSCYVSDVQDGELGRYRWKSRFSTELEFISLQIGEHVKHNELVTILCKDGYFPGNRTTGESDEVTCNDGAWSEPLRCRPRTRCTTPEAPEHGSVQLFDKPKAGIFAFYFCDDDATLVGVSASKCLNSGNWTSDPPKCLRSCNVSAIQDGELGRFLLKSQFSPEQEFISLQEGDLVKHNELVTLRCKDGYSPGNRTTDQSNEVTCNDGTWSESLNCHPKTRCTIPEAPEHGSVQLSDEPKVGTLASYFCDDDTTLVGAFTSTCLNSGNWTSDPPKCLSSCYVSAVQDGELGRYQRKSLFSTQLEFISLQVGEPVKHNDTVTLRCEEGYSPGNRTDGQSIEVTCNDGTWSEPLHCHSILCTEEPPPTDNASPVIDSRVHGHIIWYRCDPGYERTKTGNVVCKHGKWEGKPPVCADYRCHTEQLVYPGLVKPQMSFIYHEEHFAVTCEKAYTVSTLKKQVFCFEGKWNITNNPCIIKTCEEQPPTVSNGKAREFARVNGSFVHYECDKGYEIVGHSSVHCAFGEWQGQPPVCKTLLCTEEPPPTANASPVIDSREHGHIIWYRCDPGYERTKIGNVVCKHGKWEGKPPVCAD